MRKRLRKKLARKRKPLRWGKGKIFMKISSDDVFKEIPAGPLGFGGYKG